MSRLADPSTCPDCRASLDAAATCTGCGLRLSGAPGEKLWQTMLAADRMVEEIRAAGMVRPAPPVTGLTRDLPAAPPVASGPTRRGIPAFSVPVVLLSLGALCLLVAAVVFVAITWGSLGLTGRTLVLAGVTGVVGAVATLVTRRGLRGAGEALWSTVAGMLVLDLLGGRAAGLAGLDTLGWRSMSVLVGAALFTLGVGIALWVRRTPVRELWTAEGVAFLGALVASAAGAWLAPNPAVGAALVLPVLVLLSQVLRSRIPALSTGLLGLGLFSWLVLAALGLDRASEYADWSAWWGTLRGWPLLVASAYAALATLSPRLPRATRPVLAVAALAPLAVLANAPITPGLETRDSLVRVATMLALAGVAAWAPRSWAIAAAVLGGLGAVALTLQLAWQPWSAVELLPADAGASLHLPPVESAAAPWTWPLVAGAVALLLLASTRVMPRLRDVAVAGAVALVSAGLGVAALAVQPPLWAGVSAMLAAAAVVAGATWWRRASWLPAAVGTGAVAAGCLALVGLAIAEPSPSITAVAASTIAVALAVGFAASDRGDEVVAPALTGGLAVLAATYALPAWGTTLPVESDTTALVVASFAALVLLLAAPASRRTTSRLTLELTAAVPAISAAALAPDLATLAQVLTVLGSALAGVSVLNSDRRLMGWAAAVVLGGATFLRVSLDVQAPELYTLPAAALLLAAGLWRLRTDPDARSFDALGSGLALALLPSLLLALEDPLSTRGVLVGVAGLAVLAHGVHERVGASLVAGGGTVALLAVRELEPLSEAVPRWVSLAVIGFALLAVGITWEARLRNLRAAGRYLTALR